MTECIAVHVAGLIPFLDLVVGSVSFVFRILNSVFPRRRPFPSLRSAAPMACWCVTKAPERYTAARKADVAWTTPSLPPSLPPTAPPSPLEEEATPRSDHTFHSTRESDRELNANHSWNLRERVIIRGMEDYLGGSADTMVGVEELETYLLGPSDVAGIIAVLAKNGCDGGGYRRFV